MATYQDLIAGARSLIQDEITPYRYNDILLLAFANDAHAAIGALKEEVYHRIDHYTCFANEVYQKVDPASSLGIVDILANVDARTPVTRIERRDLDNFLPGWMNEAPGPAKHWMSTPGNRFVFIIYPQAEVGLQLEVLHAALPDIATIGAAFPLAPIFEQAVKFYIASRALAIDDENQNLDKSNYYGTQFNAVVVGATDEDE